MFLDITSQNFLDQYFKCLISSLWNSGSEELSDPPLITNTTDYQKEKFVALCLTLKTNIELDIYFVIKKQVNSKLQRAASALPICAAPC